MRTKVSRRDVLLAAALGAIGVAGSEIWRHVRPLIPARFASFSGPDLGHRLRTMDFPKPTSTEKTDTVIVGAGIAGLSAARFLNREGHKDFVVLELENRAGGNSVWGENRVSRYPWAAHYLPVPAMSNEALLEFLRETKVIVGERAGLPVYDESFAVHDPQERVFDGERWSAGLIPEHLHTPEMERFGKLMSSYHDRVGRDGRHGFVIPVDESSRDPEFLALDRLTMHEFLRRERFDSPEIDWYVNYCMLDDFGTPATEVSAWVGVHYFAARGGDAANLDGHSVLTWPEGNGWLMERLKQNFASRVRSGQVVFRVATGKSGAEVDVFDAKTGRSKRYACAHVIYAAPRFTAFKVIEGYSPAWRDSFQYAPWAIANVTLSAPPKSVGAPLSWDNIRYQSPILGYVVANHQDIKRFSGAIVLTMYWPLAGEPRERRGWARARGIGDWKRDFLAELERMHPGVSALVEDMEVKIWGHAMIQPRRGFMTSAARAQARENFGRVRFAHTDMSGISIFEEAFEQGRRAAAGVVKARLT